MKLVRKQEACKILGVSMSTLNRYLDKGVYTKYQVMKGAIVYIDYLELPTFKRKEYERNNTTKTA